MRGPHAIARCFYPVFGFSIRVIELAESVAGFRSSILGGLVTEKTSGRRAAFATFSSSPPGFPRIVHSVPQPLLFVLGKLCFRIGALEDVDKKLLALTSEPF